MITKNSKLYLLIILVSVLTSCGYHLRGNNSLAQRYPVIKIAISNQSLLKRPLIHALLASGVQLSEQNDSQSELLQIKKDSLIKVIQSVGINNQIQEYRLEYDVDFQIAQSPVRSLHIEKDYSFDIQQITGGQQEELTLRKQMADDMAWSIIRQINAEINEL